MSNLVLPSKELIRVLTPIDEFNKSAAGGSPLKLGSMTSFLNGSGIPRKKAKPSREYYKFQLNVKEEFKEAIYAAVPKEAFLQPFVVELSDDIFHFGGGKDVEPHLDGKITPSYYITVTAAFPNGTIFYPTYTPETGHAFKANEKAFDIGSARREQAAPGEINLFNDDRMTHAGPRNNLELEEWQEFFKDHPDHKRDFLFRDGGIRRLLARSIIKLDKDWVDEACKVPVPQLEFA